MSSCNICGACESEKPKFKAPDGQLVACEDGSHSFMADRLWYSKKCKNKSRREQLHRSAKIRETAGLTGRYSEMTLESFHVDDGNKMAFDAAKNWAEEESPGWLYVHGGVGLGKTHLGCAAISVVSRRGLPAVVVQAAEMLSRLAWGEEGADALLQYLKTVQYLVIDDLGAHRETPYAMEQLFMIVNARDDRCLPSFFTSNLKPSELANRSLDWLRIIDRIIGQAKKKGMVRVYGTSKRRVADGSI